MPKLAFKVNLDCPLCHCIMKQHPAGYFICPECKGMFSLYGGPDKAESIHRKLLARRVQTHEQWLATKLEPVKKRRAAWTLPTEKRDGQEGFQCFCNEFKRFDSYVYAHMNERLTHECEKCGSKFSIKQGVVRVLKSPTKK